MVVTQRNRSSVLAACLSVLFLVAVPAQDASASGSFTVNTTTDGVDAVPGDGVCDNGGGFCTLRAAVMEANALPGFDDISVPVGLYDLTLAGASEDAAATGDLDITSAMAIYGDSRSETVATIIDAGSLDRVFDVRPGASLTLGYLDVSNGAAPAGQTGGGIRVDAATLFTETASVWGSGTYGGGTGGGVGVLNGATVQFSDSAIWGNVASGAGGGIFSASASDSVTMQATTIGVNSSATSAGGLAANGGLYVASSTIASNGAPSVGNVVMSSVDPSSYMVNTIIADPTTSSNCGGTIPTSNGGNFENGDLCGFDKPSDTVFTSPKLGPFQWYGGSVPTMALKPGSPAIDAGIITSGGCPGFDARGVPRPFGSGCDPGAYEFATCFGKPVDIVGSNGGDHIKGTKFDDVVMSLDQPDVVRGLGGNDRICGGKMNDTLIGGPGNDMLNGGPGKDVCSGGPGKDKAVSCERHKGIP